MHTREISSLDNGDVTVLIANNAVQVTYYQSNHHISLILTFRYSRDISF